MRAILITITLAFIAAWVSVQDASADICNDENMVYGDTQPAYIMLLCIPSIEIVEVCDYDMLQG